MTKIQPIPEQLWRALAIVSNEVKDILDHATENDFGDDAEFMRVKDSYELVSEYVSCFGADGNISQRGEVPQVWNEDTIFTPHRELREGGKNQLEFDWSEEGKDESSE